MTYILRVRLGRQYGTHYGTTNHLDIRYQPTYRTRRISDYGFREMEQAGVDKSKVQLAFRRDGAIVNERGYGSLSPGNTWFRLLDRHDHIRALQGPDEIAIMERDAEIAQKEAELRELRDKRADYVARAWRRAHKITMDELEEQANAKL